MTRMPGTTWLGEHGSRLMDRYDIVCVHTIVGWAPAHAAHFSVRLDGTILQSRDTRFRSAANLDGNHRVIAIENEDGGKWWEPLTDAQVRANADILRWANETHGVPLQLCPDSRPTSRGLAYHRQGIDGNFGGHRFPGRVAGGEVWTLSRGKECPGDNKIAQLPDILTLAQGDNDMTPEQAKQLADTAVAVARVEEKLDRELQRDKNVRERDTKRHRAVMAALRDVPAETRAAVEAALNEEN